MKRTNKNTPRHHGRITPDSNTLQKVVDKRKNIYRRKEKFKKNLLDTE